MLCPSCKAPNEDASDRCFHCDWPLSAAAAIRHGSLIAGRYRIQERIGSGGEGVVYRAYDRALDETVAIKVLRPDRPLTPQTDRRFRAEIKLARRVSHRNVCRMHEYGEDGDLRFLSMAFVEGVDLKRMLVLVSRKGGLPPEQAFSVVLQVAEGLQAIHDEGIIHRDLKSPNVMIDSKGAPRLMDFGIAKEWSAPAAGFTATGMIIGTPEYMSPEQARGARLDVRSDVYALGIVVYETFTGHVPFRVGSDLVGLLYKHIHEPPPLRTPEAVSLPTGVVPVLEKALAKSPDDRYASATAMIEALREARTQAAIGVPPSTHPVLSLVKGVAGAGTTDTVVQTLVPPSPTSTADVPTVERRRDHAKRPSSWGPPRTRGFRGQHS